MPEFTTSFLRYIKHDQQVMNSENSSSEYSHGFLLLQYPSVKIGTALHGPFSLRDQSVKNNYDKDFIHLKYTGPDLPYQFSNWESHVGWKQE